MRFSPFAPATSVLALVLACSGDITSSSPVPSLSIVPGGGEAQTGTVGTTLPLPLIVQVTGVTGSPSGQILNFVVTSGGGSVFANVVLTGTPNSGPANKLPGIGQNTWTLGPTAGPQTVEARLVDPKNGATLTQAVFHATALPGSAATLSGFAGDMQSAVAGTAVNSAPAVLVADQHGNPVSGVTITFAVASGRGSITGSSQILTDGNGIAAVGAWILGATAGPNTLTATAGQLAGSPLSFNATGTVGTASQLVLLTGDAQRAEGGFLLPLSPTVQVRDVNGNGAAGVAVTFTVTAGGGSMDGITSVTTLTNQSGTASVDWTLGLTPGPNTLRATALGLIGNPVSFNATAVMSLHAANQDANSITVYDAEADANVAPLRTISGPNTGLSTPANITRDNSGQLYVTNYTGQNVAIYAMGAAGNVAPVRTISGANTGLTRPYALTRDAAGKIYVFDYASRSIVVFTSNATGNATPVLTISGPNTGLIGAPGLLVAPTGELYVSDQDAGNIKVFAAGATGNVAPVRTITGPSTGLAGPAGLQLDADGKIYVSNFFNHSITVYAADADGDATPIRTISGANTSLAFPVGLLLDGSGQLYAANYIGTSITVFAAGATGNVAPLRTIAGSNTGLNRPGWLTF